MRAAWCDRDNLVGEHPPPDLLAALCYDPVGPPHRIPNENSPTTTPSITINKDHWHGYLKNGVFESC